jgi:glutamate 5-kinase
MQQVSDLKRAHGVRVIWVTSGAIAWAASRTRFNKAHRTLGQKQGLSAIGQPLIMDQYNLALQATGQLGAQVLLTAGDMRDPVRRKNLLNVFSELKKWDVVPVLNENDAVATTEIQFGDNDALAAQVAAMVKADRLVLLTDVEGLYDRNPTRDSRAQLVAEVARVTPALLAKSKNTGKSKVGTGGIYSKLLAAKHLEKFGIVTHLVRGDRPQALLSLARGETIGTRIGSKKKRRRI